MVIKKEFTFLSRNGKDNCHAVTWEPEDGNIKAIFQIVHGMQEYVERYHAFATFLAEKGYLVVGADHLGHGKTAPTEKDLGYFGDGDVPTILVRDAHRLKKIIQEQHPGIPYFIFGHSMGSFIMRKYLAMYKKGINGAILSGTAVMPPIATGTGIFLTNMLKLFFGDRHKSRLIEKISFGSYLKKIPDATTASDWLTEDKEVVRAYRNDPLCHFRFTVNGFRALFKLLNYVCKPKHFSELTKDMPILIVSGSEDPVGNYGKGPIKVYEQFCKLGIKDVQIKLFDNVRHEPLTSLKKDEVYDYLLNWLDSHI